MNTTQLAAQAANTPPSDLQAAYGRISARAMQLVNFDEAPRSAPAAAATPVSKTLADVDAPVEYSLLLRQHAGTDLGVEIDLPAQAMDCQRANA